MKANNPKAAAATKRDQRWIDEAIASGPVTRLYKKEMDAIRDRVLRGKTTPRNGDRR